MCHTGYDEPYDDGYSDGNGTQEIAEYNTMKAQVEKYGGFFIGRYEAGDGTNGTTLRTGPTDAHTVVVKHGVAPYNYVPWGRNNKNTDEMEGMSGAVYLAKNGYDIPNINDESTEKAVTSTLCYGIQWDAICRYIEPGKAKMSATSKSAAELTGSEDRDKAKNIYDLAGNCYEWTMERLGDDRIKRGGSYNNSGLHISSRYNYGYCWEQFQSYSFRLALYIK